MKMEQPPGFSLLVAVQATEMAEADDFELMLKDCVQERM
jgi:hypothetical protein